MMGKSTPIPFSETNVSPDKVSDLYTKTPSNTKFDIMFRRFRTNCPLRLLKLKIDITVKMTEMPIKPKTNGSSLLIIAFPASSLTVGNQ